MAVISFPGTRPPMQWKVTDTLSMTGFRRCKFTPDELRDKWRGGYILVRCKRGQIRRTL